jgi:hypothetical protein
MGIKHNIAYSRKLTVPVSWLARKEVQGPAEVAVVTAAAALKRTAYDGGWAAAAGNYPARRDRIPPP